MPSKSKHEPDVLNPREFRRRVESWAAELPRPEIGFFGPESYVWKITREAGLFIYGPYALLMQIAHPKVAQAVFDHSDFRSDPYGRGFRTFDAVYKIVFGSARTAIDAATKVYAVHSRIRGRVQESVPGMTNPEYVANDAKLLQWVHATLIESTLRGYEMLFRPLTGRELDGFYEESKVFARLFCVREDVIPETIGDFREYYASMIADELFVTDPGREVANALFYQGPNLLAPLRLPARILAAGQLDPHLRHQFGLRWNAPVKTIFDFGVGTARRMFRPLPATLRMTPSARVAYRNSAKKLAA